MSENLLDRYVHRAAPTARDSTDTVDDLVCFGILRGTRERCPSIELRRKGGNVLVIGYGWIEAVEFDPSQGLTIKTGGRTIRLKGRNLSAELRPGVTLVSAMAAHRVAWVQEMDKTNMLTATKDIPLVEAIEW